MLSLKKQVPSLHNYPVTLMLSAEGGRWGFSPSSPLHPPSLASALPFTAHQSVGFDISSDRFRGIGKSARRLHPHRKTTGAVGTHGPAVRAHHLPRGGGPGHLRREAAPQANPHTTSLTLQLPHQSCSRRLRPFGHPRDAAILPTSAPLLRCLVQPPGQEVRGDLQCCLEVSSPLLHLDTLGKLCHPAHPGYHLPFRPPRVSQCG